MPKTYNNLFQSIVSWENLLAAYHEARSGKRYRGQVLAFSENLEENLIQIQNELIWKMWTPHNPRHFEVKEPKLRPIAAPVFYDRVVHHAIVRVIEPLFDKKFIYKSCACRTGKGKAFALKESTEMVRQVENGEYAQNYVLKADIKSYFPSIIHELLKKKYRRTVRCKNTLRLMDSIVDSCGFDGRGLPIGYLTSQLFANIYLDSLDHFVVDELGHGKYIRYMDDFLIFGSDKDELKSVKDTVEAYLNQKLCLQLNPKTDIIPITHGVDFCGYRIFRPKILPRKRNVKRAKRRLKKLAEQPVDMEKYRAALMSFLGYMKHCNGYKTTCSVLDAAKIGGNDDT
jgi:retron-type reverse transcriptase